MVEGVSLTPALSELADLPVDFGGARAFRWW